MSDIEKVCGTNITNGIMDASIITAKKKSIYWNSLKVRAPYIK